MPSPAIVGRIAAGIPHRTQLQPSRLITRFKLSLRSSQNRTYRSIADGLHASLDHSMLQCNMMGMRIAIIDDSAARASIIEEGLAEVEGCEIFILSGRDGLLARVAEIAPDIVLMDLGNPSRDVLEEYFAVSRALARPIAMFVDQSDDEAIAASVDAGVSAYVVDGLAANRIRPLLDLAVRRFNAFARLQTDLAEAKGKLADRETVDKAKRILMDSKGITEPEAYGELRRKAMSSNRRISSIAEAIVTAHELLGDQG